MEIRYTRVFWIPLAIVSALYVGVMIIAALAADPRPSFQDWAIAILVAVIAVRAATAPVCTIEGTQVVMHALIGPLKRRYEFDSV